MITPSGCRGQTYRSRETQKEAAQVKETKALGIIVDEQLLWEKQKGNIITKVSKRFGMLMRMKASVPKSTLFPFIMLQTIIFPHFHYCNLIWDNFSNYLLDKLQLIM